MLAHCGNPMLFPRRALGCLPGPSGFLLAWLAALARRRGPSSTGNPCALHRLFQRDRAYLEYRNEMLSTKKAAMRPRMLP